MHMLASTRFTKTARSTRPHSRRKFYDLHKARPSALSTEALRRIAELYVIKADIRGRPPDQQRQARQTRARPLLDDLERWLRAALERLSRKFDTSAAILYMLNLWPALKRYYDDGAIEIDNSAAELALRGLAIGRRYLHVDRYGRAQRG